MHKEAASVGRLSRQGGHSFPDRRSLRIQIAGIATCQQNPGSLILKIGHGIAARAPTPPTEFDLPGSATNMATRPAAIN
jgi:hypothetical protein